MKVFCAVGNMNRNFGRFVRKIHELDKTADHQIIFQSGYSVTNEITWKHTKLYPFLSNADFQKFISEVDIVICHAGVGVITDCLRKNKMPVIMTRSASFDEHVNDHQVDFAARYVCDGLFHLIDDETNIVEYIQNIDFSESPQRDFIHDLAGLRSSIHLYLRETLLQ